MVKRNGKPGDPGIIVEIPEDANSLDALRETLKEDHLMKHIDNCKFFNREGNEITEGTLILSADKDVIYMEPLPERAFDFSSLLEEYKVLEKLGQGGFGKVHKAQHKITQQIAAIKYIDITECSKIFHLS